MSIDKRVESFGYSFNGIRIAWREEYNFRFQIICTLIVLALSWALHISRIEFLIVLSMIGFVLTAETLNTSLEELCDKFQPTHDPHIAKIKDLAAGAVLIAASTSFIVGCVIFIPYLAASFL